MHANGERANTGNIVSCKNVELILPYCTSFDGNFSTDHYYHTYSIRHTHIYPLHSILHKMNLFASILVVRLVRLPICYHLHIRNQSNSTSLQLDTMICMLQMCTNKMNQINKHFIFFAMNSISTSFQNIICIWIHCKFIFFVDEIGSTHKLNSFEIVQQSVTVQQIAYRYSVHTYLLEFRPKKKKIKIQIKLYQFRMWCV